MKNPVVHFEIQSQDPAALRAFYGELFDWQMDVHDAIDYSVITTKAQDDPDGINGGIMHMKESGPTALTVYVQVDDIEASLKRAVELGATVIVPVTTIPKTVTFALFADPQGNCIGMAASQIPD